MGTRKWEIRKSRATRTATQAWMAVSAFIGSCRPLAVTERASRAMKNVAFLRRFAARVNHTTHESVV